MDRREAMTLIGATAVAAAIPRPVLALPAPAEIIPPDRWSVCVRCSEHQYRQDRCGYYRVPATLDFPRLRSNEFDTSVTIATFVAQLTGWLVDLELWRIHERMAERRMTLATRLSLDPSQSDCYLFSPMLAVTGQSIRIALPERAWWEGWGRGEPRNWADDESRVTIDKWGRIA